MTTERKIIYPDITQPIADPDTGIARSQFRIFTRQLFELGLFVGTGSPEGVVEAQQGAEYMDDTGTAGNIKYIKRDADIGGDRTQGWILV